ncbi:hypothetical protein [Pontixanthobacter aquaemixtae]|uniref:Uncharacterized protein n=1 Tax=Pontixanthobacter aquaemixtae TaxID=1958940 RepID=A0A844ZSL5_9SPHN|nr:hypothetical protein [Pontixanthobacter aquaemixtae]MXO90845.1 hypothetical protein [Pontixanthobacter aquaemixtae]
MLKLGPPYFDIEGVAVMSDAHDDRQFYYVPNAPHIAVDDQGRPAIRFIVLKDAHDAIIGNSDDTESLPAGEDSEDISGFLFFDTVLSWPDETLNKVRKELSKRLEDAHEEETGERIEIEVQLAPLPYRKGSVRLTMLDKTTREIQIEPELGPDGEPLTEPETETVSAWVPFAHTPGVPSLYGENRAVFQAKLSRKAVKLLYGAFSGLIPASVYYDLQYVGQMQGYNVSVSADWEQVYDFIQKRHGVNLGFFSADVEKTTTEMIENKIINIEAEVDATETDIAVEQQMDDFETVKSDLQDMVLQTFFEPTTNPNEDPDSINTLSRLHGLKTSWAPVGYSRRELSVTELRSISVDYTVRRAVKRRIAPQAHMHVFFEDLNVTRDDLVTVVDGNDSIWREVDMQVGVNGDFERNDINQVVVDVQYTKTLDLEPDLEADPDAQWSFVFETGEERFNRSSWYSDDVGTNFFYRYRVFFNGSGLPGPASSAASEWRRIDSNVIMADTAELFERQDVQIQAVNSFPWDRYPQVFVRLRYDDTVSEWRHEDAKLLSQNDAIFTTAFRQRAKDGIEPEYQLQYLRNDGESITTAWEPVKGDIELILSPDPQQMEVRVIVSPATRIGDHGFVIVDMNYEDVDNNVSETVSMMFTADNVRLPQTWKVPWKDPTKRRYKMSQLIIDSEGNVTNTGFVETEGNTQIVGTTFAKTMTVQPKMIGPELGPQNIDKIMLRLKYEDAANGVLSERMHEISAPGDVPSWTVMLKDASLREYSYELTYVLNTGFTQSTGIRTQSDNFPIFSTALPE